MLSSVKRSSVNIYSLQARYASQHLSKFASIDPLNLSVKDKCQNLVGGEWTGAANYIKLPDPLTGKEMISVPDTGLDEILPFIDSIKNTPKSGLHNPYKNKERYVMLGGVMTKCAEVLHDPEVFDFFVDSI